MRFFFLYSYVFALNDYNRSQYLVQLRVIIIQSALFFVTPQRCNTRRQKRHGTQKFLAINLAIKMKNRNIMRFFFLYSYVFAFILFGNVSYYNGAVSMGAKVACA